VWELALYGKGTNVNVKQIIYNFIHHMGSLAKETEIIIKHNNSIMYARKHTHMTVMYKKD